MRDGIARIVLAGLLAALFGALVGASGAAAESLDRAARLDAALAEYASALGEADRDARVAGFARAERAFASLVDDGVETAALWTNLGNAALQAGRTGRAVLAYHRALGIDPDDATAAQNLAYVRGRLPATVPRPADTEGRSRGLGVRDLPPAVRSAVAGALFLAAAVFLALFVRRGEGAWRALAVVAALGWALLLALPRLGDESDRAPLAVVTQDDVAARSADSALAPLAFPDPLPAGVEVRLLEARENWARVRLANGRDVWLRASSVTPVDG